MTQLARIAGGWIGFTGEFRVIVGGDVTISAGATVAGTNTGDQNTFTTISVAGQSDVVADGTSDTLTLVAGSNITITTNAATDTITITATGGGGGDALTSNPLSQFASTTSAELRGVISDETGSGALVFANLPTISNPTIDGDILGADTINALHLVLTSSATIGGVAVLTTAAIDDTAYNEATWNGDTTHAPSKNAVRDKIESMSTGTGTVGTLNVNTTGVGNVGTGEDDLITYSVPGGTLASDGDYITFEAAGTFASSLNNKRLRFKFGSTTVFDSGALAITAATDWLAAGTIIRKSATTFTAAVELNTASATLSAYADFVLTGTETLSGALTLKGTGEATATDDVRQEWMLTRINSNFTPIALSDGDKGDITVSSGGAAWTVDNNAVTYAKMQDVTATSRVLGRKTAGSGDPEECTLSEILDFIGSAARGDILYRGASSWSRLAAGTSGQFLKTLGAGADPAWDTPAGGAGTKTYAVFTALSNNPPSANFATLDTRNSIPVLDFDDTTEEAAIFIGIMPESASLGSGLIVRIQWMATTATTGDARWGVQFERMNTDEDADSFDTATEATTTTSGTAGIITVTAITATAIDGITAGDPYRLKIYRDVSGADSITGDLEIVSVEIRSAA